MVRFDEIFGQEAAISAILRAYERDRLPHGLIFAGPAGVGKATTARALASLFLCEKPSAGSACGKCTSCVLMNVLDAQNGSTNHPDYHVVYRQLIRLEKESRKARDLSIDVVRRHLIAPAELKPAMSRGKAFVIEEAELMNAAAQNAMLKTMEEPHGRTLIILLTDQPQALLPTLRSRSQIVPFAPLDEARVREELQKRKIHPAIARQAAELAGGSLGLALKWIEDGVVAQAQTLLRQMDALSAGGKAPELAGSFKAAAEAYAQSQLKRDELASKDQAAREGAVLYLRIFADYLRRHLRENENVQGLQRLCDAIEALAKSEEFIDSNVSLPLVAQQLSGKLGQILSAA